MDKHALCPFLHSYQMLLSSPSPNSGWKGGRCLLKVWDKEVDFTLQHNRKHSGKTPHCLKIPLSLLASSVLMGHPAQHHSPSFLLPAFPLLHTRRNSQVTVDLSGRPVFSLLLSLSSSHRCLAISPPSKPQWSIRSYFPKRQ